MKFISLVLHVYRNISYLKFLQGADFSPLFVSLRQPNSAVDPVSWQSRLASSLNTLPASARQVLGLQCARAYPLNMFNFIKSTQKINLTKSFLLKIKTFKILKASLIAGPNYNSRRAQSTAELHSGKGEQSRRYSATVSWEGTVSNSGAGQLPGFLSRDGKLFYELQAGSIIPAAWGRNKYHREELGSLTSNLHVSCVRFLVTVLLC